MLCVRIPKYTYVECYAFYFQANGWAPIEILWSLEQVNSSFFSAQVLQGCTSSELPLSQSYSLKRFVSATYLLRTNSYTSVDKGCNSHESPLSMVFLPQTQVSRISLCYLEATSVPLGLNSYAPFSNKFLYVDKGCKSQDSPLSMSFLPQTQVSRISLGNLGVTSVPLGLNSYAPFSNKFLYVDKGCLLYTSPSPRDRG